MTDEHNQLQFSDMALPPKRGRPPSGNALSNAEKQRLYRLRNKQKPKSKSTVTADEVQALHDLYGQYLEKAYEDNRSLAKRLESASLGWPEVLEQNCQYARVASVWKLKCRQLERIIEKAGLPFPDSWNTDTEFTTDKD